MENVKCLYCEREDFFPKLNPYGLAMFLDFIFLYITTWTLYIFLWIRQSLIIRSIMYPMLIYIHLMWNGSHSHIHLRFCIILVILICDRFTATHRSYYEGNGIVFDVDFRYWSVKEKGWLCVQIHTVYIQIYYILQI